MRIAFDLGVAFPLALGRPVMPAASSGLGALAPMARTALRRLRDPNDVRAAVAVSVALCVGELALCSLIVWRVPYTEIDWRAYMDLSLIHI